MFLLLLLQLPALLAVLLPVLLLLPSKLNSPLC